MRIKMRSDFRTKGWRFGGLTLSSPTHPPFFNWPFENFSNVNPLPLCHSVLLYPWNLQQLDTCASVDTLWNTIVIYHVLAFQKNNKLWALKKHRFFWVDKCWCWDYFGYILREDMKFIFEWKKIFFHEKINFIYSYIFIFFLLHRYECFETKTKEK